MTPKIIAVDFDGTCVTHEFPFVGKDIGAARVLRRLVADGHKIILYTMRGHSTKSPIANNLENSVLDDAKHWFKDNLIPLYGVNENPGQHKWTSSPKVYAQLYIDDAALGCPLVHNPEVCERPYVDWLAVEKILFPTKE